MSRITFAPRLSGERHNAIIEQIIAGSQRRTQMFVREMTASGPPPGMVAGSEVQEYTTLIAAAERQDPRFISSPEAQARLQQLEAVYGQPAPQPVQPITGNAPQPLSALARATQAVIRAKAAP